MVLHQVFNSPFNSAELQRFCEHAQENDALLLLQDAVYALNHPLFSSLLTQQKTIYILANDLLARGLVCHVTQVKVISDQQWLALCVESNKVISWT